MRQNNSAHQNTQELLSELSQAHSQLQAYSTQAEQLAVAEERNRLARELHDSLGHRLTVAILQLEGAQRLIDTKPSKAQEIVGNMRQELKSAMGELRQTLGSLRSAETTPPPNSLQDLTHTFQQATNLNIALTLPDPMPDLPDTHRLALYRAVQEGLTNIQRHAAATRAWVSVTHTNDQISLTIEDNGRGLSGTVKDGSFGLLGLQERADALNGTFQIENRPAGGTQLHFQFPL